MRRDVHSPVLCEPHSVTYTTSQSYDISLVGTCSLRLRRVGRRNIPRHRGIVVGQRVIRRRQLYYHYRSVSFAPHRASSLTFHTKTFWADQLTGSGDVLPTWDLYRSASDM
jgi:hypothetical protein